MNDARPSHGASPAAADGGRRADHPFSVLVCTPRFAPQIGGAETWTREVTRALARRGHAVAVLARAAHGLDREGHIDGVAVHRVSGSRARFGREIWRHVHEMRPDVVLAQYSALPFSVLSAKAASLPSLGIVHDVYGLRDSVRIKGPLVGAARTLGLEQWLRALAPDGFLVPSRATALRLSALARTRATTVVPAGADHLPAGGIVERSETQLVFVGRLVAQKGVADLIDALNLLRARGRTFSALVIGRGPEERPLRARAASLGDLVRFAGSISDERLDEAIRSSLALVLPSTREGWGLAITEAAARGTPYVAYDTPAVREQHEQIGGGLLTSPGVAPLASAIADLLDDPKRARGLGERGLDATAALSWDTAAEAVERAILDVVRTRARPKAVVDAPSHVRSQVRPTP